MHPEIYSGTARPYQSRSLSVAVWSSDYSGLESTVAPLLYDKYGSMDVETWASDYSI